MARIRQFAKDMGLSYNEAKNLVNKGRRLKDGGSTTLEKFMPVKAKNGKVTRINKDKTMQAKAGQFKNIVKDSVSGKITPEEAQKMIRKLVIAKQRGGGFDAEFEELRERMRVEERARRKPMAQSRKERLPESRRKTTGKFNLDLMRGTGALKKEDFPPKKEKNISKPKKRTSPKVVSPGKQKPTMTDDEVKAELRARTKPRMGAGTSKMRQSMPRGDITKKMKDGGAAFPDLSGDGKVTKKDILIGRGVIKKSRGGGIAIQGTGFKGVR